MENKIMIRDLLGLKVEQRTEDAYFNATLLFQQWNENNPNKIRRFDNWLKTIQTQELIIKVIEEDKDKLLKDSHFLKLRKSVKTNDLVEIPYSLLKKVVVKQQKGQRFKEGGSEKSIYWLHPLLFIDCCQYISVDFKIKAIKMVADQLLVYRVDICNRYNQWCDFLQNKLGGKNWDFSNTQKEMNKAVFGYHETKIRDKATENQLRLMEQYEDTIYNMFDLGFIKDCKDVRNALKIFQQKNFPKEQ